MPESTIFRDIRHQIPEHIRLVTMFSGGYPFTLQEVSEQPPLHSRIPEDIRSFMSCNSLSMGIFRIISVHFSMALSHLGKTHIKTEITMAGNPISAGFFATMPFNDYAFAYAVPSQKVEDFFAND